jgi:cell wall-associated NlpC family hydrolase
LQIRLGNISLNTIVQKSLQPPAAWRLLVIVPVLLVLGACGAPSPRPSDSTTATAHRSATVSPRAQEVVFYALSLVDTGYRFGGKNPQAGLDCSGMVAYVFERAAGLKVVGNAAEIAGRGRGVDRGNLRPGDLVFFNTLNRPLSHVGIYIGDERFVHAPSTNGKVRIDRLDNTYFALRFEGARSYFD